MGKLNGSASNTPAERNSLPTYILSSSGHIYLGVKRRLVVAFALLKNPWRRICRVIFSQLQKTSIPWSCQLLKGFRQCEHLGSGRTRHGIVCSNHLFHYDETVKCCSYQVNFPAGNIHFLHTPSQVPQGFWQIKTKENP